MPEEHKITVQQPHPFVPSYSQDYPVHQLLVDLDTWRNIDRRLLPYRNHTAVKAILTRESACYRFRGLLVNHYYNASMARILAYVHLRALFRMDLILMQFIRSIVERTRVLRL